MRYVRLVDTWSLARSLAESGVDAATYWTPSGWFVAPLADHVASGPEVASILFASEVRS